MKQLKISTKFTARDEKGISAYLRDINKIPLLSINEEVELARRIKNGELEASHKLAEANLRFVVSVAKQYQNNGLQLWDLIDAGNEGLYRATFKFDETRGFKFISYAVWWVRQAIMETLNNHSKIIRLPGNKSAINSKISDASAELAQKLNREPTDEEIMEFLDIDYEAFSFSFFDKKSISIDTPRSDEGDLTLLDSIPNDETSPDELLIKSSLEKDLRSLMNLLLEEKEREILTLYYGLGGDKPVMLDEIAERLKMSRERARQIKEHALRKIRKNSKKQILIPYLG